MQSLVSPSNVVQYVFYIYIATLGLEESLVGYPFNCYIMCISCQPPSSLDRNFFGGEIGIPKDERKEGKY